MLALNLENFENEVKKFYSAIREGNEEKMKALRRETRDKTVARLKTLEPVWGKYAVSQVYLYGSYADAGFDALSDINIAVEPDIAYEQLTALYADVDKQFRQTIDLRLLSEIPFAHKIKQQGILIYDRKDSNS